MSRSLHPTPNALVTVVALLACSFVISACGAPTADEGRARLVGTYVLADRRVQTSEISPAYRSASLVLLPGGVARQICEFRDGAKYESSGMTWKYSDDGNVTLSPLKDCSWVW